MKTRIAIFVIWFAAASVNIGWAQTIIDRARHPWTCRAPDSLIYTQSGPRDHIYDIAAAKAHQEPHDPNNHNPICIDALNDHRITWTWLGANRVKVIFVSLTDDRATGGTCYNSTQPFTGAPSDSGVYDFLPSGKAIDSYSGCAYEVKFKSSLGPYDPHIIIKGSYTATLPELQEKVKDLEALEKELKADEEKLEKLKK